MKQEKSRKTGHFRNFLSRFRREERGVISIEIAIAASFLSLGFAALLSTVSSVDNAHAGEQAMNDMVLTVRAIPDVDDMTVRQLRRRLISVAQDNLIENQRATLQVRRLCGCQLENRYAGGLCRANRTCSDGTTPGRFVELDLRIRPRSLTSDPDVSERFRYRSMVQYTPKPAEDSGA